MSTHSVVADRSGFSIIEVIVAMVILSVGLLSMAATTGFVATQVRVTDLRTERGTALSAAIEQLRATPFNDLNNRSEADALTIGGFEMWWDVTHAGSHLREVEVYSRATHDVPGTAGYVAAQDTFHFSISRP